MSAARIALERECDAARAAEVETRLAVLAAQGRGASPAEMRRLTNANLRALKKMGAAQVKLTKLIAKESKGKPA